MFYCRRTEQIAVTLEELKTAIRNGETPISEGEPVMALWHDARGDWERAHESVQSDSSKEAAWVHAYLHRKEGDSSNAAYWYSRAGRNPSSVSLDREWESIAQELLTREQY